MVTFDVYKIKGASYIGFRTKFLPKSYRSGAEWICTDDLGDWMKRMRSKAVCGMIQIGVLLDTSPGPHKRDSEMHQWYKVKQIIGTTIIPTPSPVDFMGRTALTKSMIEHLLESLPDMLGYHYGGHRNLRVEKYKAFLFKMMTDELKNLIDNYD